MSTATATESNIQLTQQQLNQYRDEGYTVVRGLIPAAELREAQRTLLAIEEGDHDWPDDFFQWMDPTQLRNAKGTRIPVGVQLPSKRSPDFARIANHPNLVSAMSQLLGGPVTRFTDQCGIKSRYITSEQGGQTFFHQDSYYWHIDPSLGCNCWIPFDAVDKDSIALAVMPRSQQGWKLLEHEQYYDDPLPFGGRSDKPYQRHRIPLGTIDFSKEVLIPMQPGDGLFFTNYTWHRSEKNKTGRTLCFYAIAYQLANAEMATPRG